MSSTERPSFVLTDRLPAETLAPLLLGRWVTDITHPTHEYCAEDPRPLLKNKPFDVCDADVSTVLSTVKSATAQANLQSIFRIVANDQESSEHNHKPKQVITRSLPQQ